MLVLFLSILITSALAVTIFLLLISGDIEQLKDNFVRPNGTELPFITMEGKLVRTKEELEAELQYLKEKLAETKKSLETSKTKVVTATMSIDQLSKASVEAKKYYLRLKDEIEKTEKECELMQSRIEKYSETNKELQRRLSKNGAVDSDLAAKTSGMQCSCGSFSTNKPSTSRSQPREAENTTTCMTKHRKKQLEFVEPPETIALKLSTRPPTRGLRKSSFLGQKCKQGKNKQTVFCEKCNELPKTKYVCKQKDEEESNKSTSIGFASKLVQSQERSLCKTEKQVQELYRRPIKSSTHSSDEDIVNASQGSSYLSQLCRRASKLLYGTKSIVDEGNQTLSQNHKGIHVNIVPAESEVGCSRFTTVALSTLSEEEKLILELDLDVTSSILLPSESDICPCSSNSAPSRLMKSASEPPVRVYPQRQVVKKRAWC